MKLVNYKLHGGPHDGLLIKTYGNKRVALACKQLHQLAQPDEIIQHDFKYFIYELTNGRYQYQGIE